MIKLIMLTGFLGSGKTTLLQSLIEEYQDEKIAVLINEFGSVNIDAEIIRQDGIEIAELSNGSIFCACIKDHFVETLIRLSKRDIDYLFIEASGLADPANMPNILDGIRSHLGQEYRYAHSLCVVDGTTFCEMSELLVALKKQVAFSDYVIINKADLFTEEQFTDCCEIIREVNPTAAILPASFCKIDIHSVVDSPSALTGSWEETSNTYDSRPVTVILKERRAVCYSDFKDFLAQIAKSAYRIKGFLDTDEGSKEISCVGEQISVAPWGKEIREARLVVISSVGIRIVSVVTGAMNTYLHGELSL